MSPSSPSFCTTRLERLDFGSGGAAFALDGQPVRLHADAQAASVATLREFYQPALADCYARAATLRRPSLFGRLRSWVGSLLSRFAPDPAAAPYPAHLPPAPEAPSRPPAAAAAPAAEMRPAPNPGASAPRSLPAPPVLQLVFADREGVHLTWELGPAGREPGTAAPPRFVLTYHLDSAMAQRLQDCYGQLTRLGFKVADLETLRPAPPKVPGPAPAPEPAEGASPEPSRAAEPAAKPRRIRAPAQLPLVPTGPAAEEPRPPAPALPEP